MNHHGVCCASGLVWATQSQVNAASESTKTSSVRHQCTQNGKSHMDKYEHYWNPVLLLLAVVQVFH